MCCRGGDTTEERGNALILAYTNSLPDKWQLAYIHRIDNVLFAHGGLADEFVKSYIPEDMYNDTEEVLKMINKFGCGEMWQDLSPIWYRPQYYTGKLYQEDSLLQVVGHTPVEKITRKKNLISCDVFSTDQERNPIGTEEFLIIDTVAWESSGVR